MRDRHVQYPTRYRMTKVAGTDDIYEMEPVPGEVTDEGTIINKAALLKDTTAALFGFTAEQIPDTVPDDVLALLGPYTQYWWRKREITYSAKLTETTTSLTVFHLSYTDDILYYADAISFDDYGNILLVDPVVMEFSAMDFSLLLGKYITGARLGESVYYVHPDATTYSSGNNRGLAANTTDSVATVTTFADWVFIRSNDRNAYPNSGIFDKIEYSFLGKPLDTAAVASKIDVGSFVGTGVADETITIPTAGVPKFCIMAHADTDFYNSGISDIYIWVPGIARQRIYSGTSTATNYLNFSCSEEGLSVYESHVGSWTAKFNTGTIYYVIAT